MLGIDTPHLRDGILQREPPPDTEIVEGPAVRLLSCGDTVGLFSPEAVTQLVPPHQLTHQYIMESRTTNPQERALAFLAGTWLFGGGEWAFTAKVYQVVEAVYNVRVTRQMLEESRPPDDFWDTVHPARRVPYMADAFLASFVSPNRSWSTFRGRWREARKNLCLLMGVYPDSTIEGGFRCYKDPHGISQRLWGFGSTLTDPVPMVTVPLTGCFPLWKPPIPIHTPWGTITPQETENE